MKSQLAINVTSTPLPEMGEASASDLIDKMMAEFNPVRTSLRLSCALATTLSPSSFDRYLHTRHKRMRPPPGLRNRPLRASAPETDPDSDPPPPSMQGNHLHSGCTWSSSPLSQKINKPVYLHSSHMMKWGIPPCTHVLYFEQQGNSNHCQVHATNNVFGACIVTPEFLKSFINIQHRNDTDLGWLYVYGPGTGFSDDATNQWLLLNNLHQTEIDSFGHSTGHWKLLESLKNGPINLSVARVHPTWKSKKKLSV
eukprot:1148242-Pelagomonas_calceolata.AAC.1